MTNPLAMSLLPINRQPTRRQLRVFGAAWLVLLAACSLRLWHHHHPAPALTLLLLALLVPLAGLAHAEVLRRTYLGLSTLTSPLGWALSWIVLTLAYYAVVTPIALVMRLGGHDPLRRRFDRSAASYWLPRPPSRPAETYFRQN